MSYMAAPCNTDAASTVGTCFFMNDEETKAAMQVVKDAVWTYKEHGNGEDEHWGKPLAGTSFLILECYPFFFFTANFK